MKQSSFSGVACVGGRVQGLGFRGLGFRPYHYTSLVL